MINNDDFALMAKDPKVRIGITSRSHILFFHFYFPHYIKSETADFQKEIFELTQNDSIENMYLIAFRGSAKSTILTTSYPIWSILGYRKEKYILIVSQTRIQARQHLANIKIELETNSLLKNDLGPFKEESDEWGALSLTFTKLNARITAISSEQSIRGSRHLEHRPSLIICDDIEDIQSCKTKESRDKTYQWFMSEIRPLGDENTRFVCLGNLLHDDSLLMRVKRKISNGEMEGVFKEYPLITKDGVCLWPGKFKTKDDVEVYKKHVGDEIAWQREYLLRILPPDDQIIKPEWIKRYKNLEDIKRKYPYKSTYISVDLAVSQNARSDYTSIVVTQVFGFGSDLKICIMPNPINQKLIFPDTVKKIKTTYINMIKYPKCTVLVEGVGTQSGLTQMLQSEGVIAESVSLGGLDKSTRLMLASQYIQSGKVLFSEYGNEELITQLIGFGTESHDDLVDALSLAINYISKLNHDRPSPFPRNELSQNEECRPITYGLRDKIF